MSRFAEVLRQVSAELDLPQPTKSRILLEMAGDLEDLYQHHLSRGLDEAAAAQSAEEAFVASDEALKHLARIHESGARLSDRAARQVGTLWEKALLVIWVLAVILLVGKVATEERFFYMVSPFVWPIVALAVAAFAFSMWKLYELFLRKPPDVRRLRSGLNTLLFLSAVTLAVSASGYLYNLRWLAYNSYESAPEVIFRMAGTWFLATSSMVILGLSTATFTALMWFLLANLVARFERREVNALLAQ
ncbi:MAG: hypothetical protein GY769_15170 [bacterium]|nr:hypothetical protein [bacterium]